MSTVLTAKKPATPPVVAPKQAEQLEKIQSEERREAAQAKKAQTAKPSRYLITSKLAQAKRDDPNAYNHVGTKIALEVHEGWTGKKDEQGQPRWREGGKVVLYDGEGFTDNDLWAEYLGEQWPELTIKKSGTRTATSEEMRQRLEIEALKAEFEEEDGE